MSQDSQNPIVKALDVVFGPLIEKTSQLSEPLAYGSAIIISLIVLLILGVVIPNNLIWLLAIIIISCLVAFVYLDHDKRKRPRNTRTINGTLIVHVFQKNNKSIEINGAEVKIDLPDPQIEYTNDDGCALYLSILPKYIGKTFDIIVKHKSYIPKVAHKQLLSFDRVIEIYLKPIANNIESELNWKIKVFNFKNYSQQMEQEHLGERFSGIILNSLLQFNIDAGKIAEEPVIIPMRSNEPMIDWSEYEKYLPFIAIIGFLSPIDKNNIKANIRVVSVTSIVKAQPILIKEVNSGTKPDDMRESAEEIAKIIKTEIIKFIST